MAEKIKRFLKDDKKVSKLISGSLIFAVVLLIVGQGALAYFYRTDLPTTGWQYGYGYGSDYGYGYGYGYGSADNSAWFGYGYLYSQRAPSSSIGSITTTGATIAVTTSYIAHAKVDYGISPGSYSFNGTYPSPMATEQDFVFTDFTCGTTYYYQITARDTGGSEYTESEQHFVTSSCGGGGSGGGTATTVVVEVPTQESQQTATAAAGGEVTLTASDGSVAQVTVPAEAITADTTLNVTRSASTEAVSAGSVESAPGVLVMVGNAVYEITATDAAGSPVSEFSADVTLTFTYTDSQIEGLDEDSLEVYMWDGSEWVALGGTVDAVNNTITATTDHFTYFAIMGGEEEAEEPLTAAILKEMIKDIIRQLIALIAQLIVELQNQLAALLAGS